MDASTKEAIRLQIDVYLRKYPTATGKQVKKFIYTGAQDGVDLDNVSQATLRQFICYNIHKFKESGSCVDRVAGSGRHQEVISQKQIVQKVVKSFLGKQTPGQRNTAKKLNISQSSVSRILKHRGIKCFHKRREQAMNEVHKMNRVKYGKWLLRNLGTDGRKGKWLRFFNTDFSAILRTHPRHNSKNNVAYARDKNDIRDLLANKEKKFSPGVMLWGGISSKGLVPDAAPLFVDEVLSPWRKGDGAIQKTVNSVVYADMLETLVKPAADKIFKNFVFQDDEATIHRTSDVLNTVDGLFKDRIPPGMASMTADLYPIENVWSILKDEVAKQQPLKDVKELKKVIKQAWRKLDRDKPLLKKMMASIPERVKAMVQIGGNQVHKGDYPSSSGDG